MYIRSYKHIVVLWCHICRCTHIEKCVNIDDRRGVGDVGLIQAVCLVIEKAKEWQLQVVVANIYVRKADDSLSHVAIEVGAMRPAKTNKMIPNKRCYS